MDWSLVSKSWRENCFQFMIQSLFIWDSRVSIRWNNVIFFSVNPEFRGSVEGDARKKVPICEKFQFIEVTWYWRVDIRKHFMRIQFFLRDCRDVDYTFFSPLQYIQG